MGEAQEAQLDPGLHDYLVYDIKDVAGPLMGKVLVTNTSGGGHTANREYRYMTSNLSNSATFKFEGGTSEYWSNTTTPL